MLQSLCFPCDISERVGSVVTVQVKSTGIMFTVGGLDRYVGRYIRQVSTDTRPIYRPRVGR